MWLPSRQLNLIDYYLISRERFDVPALYDRRGRYAAWSIAALVSYIVGVVGQISFLAQKLYTGPMTDLLGGADISWTVGLVLTAAVYYPWAVRTANPPERMIYPEHAKQRA